MGKSGAYDILKGPWSDEAQKRIEDMQVDNPWALTHGVVTGVDAEKWHKAYLSKHVRRGVSMQPNSSIRGMAEFAKDLKDLFKRCELAAEASETDFHKLWFKALRCWVTLGTDDEKRRKIKDISSFSGERDEGSTLRELITRADKDSKLDDKSRGLLAKEYCEACGVERGGELLLHMITGSEGWWWQRDWAITEEIAKNLCSGGADVTIRGWDGKTSLRVLLDGTKRWKASDGLNEQMDHVKNIFHILVNAPRASSEDLLIKERVENVYKGCGLEQLARSWVESNELNKEANAGDISRPRRKL